MSKQIKIFLRDFSTEPFGRYPDDGPYCGEVFRDTVLVPQLNQSDITKVIVDLDGLDIDLGSSFLEEAFGGIIRKHLLSPKLLEQKLEVISSDDYDLFRVKKYIEKATHASQGYAVISKKS